MANSTVTLKVNVDNANGVTPFGWGETVSAFSVQFTNYGPGILAVGGSQSTFTSVSSTNDCVLVYPGQVSPTFWSAGATENDGTSDLCIASLGNINGDELVCGAAVTIIG